MNRLISAGLQGLIFFLATSIAYAGPGSQAHHPVHSGEISGVLTRCGQADTGVLVHIPGLSITARTNVSGNFTLLYVPIGKHTVLFERNNVVIHTLPDVLVQQRKISNVGGQDVCADADNDGFNESTDCDDQNPNVFPGATEDCDGIDNNCDGQVDEGCPECTDSDQDGFFAQPDCGSAVDCDDENSAVNPGADETCLDSIDNNCDGQTDEDCLSCTPGELCDPGLPGECATGVYDAACTCVSDTTPQPETCDGLDNDCDGQTDEDLAGSSCKTGLPGVCGDGAGICTNGKIECVPTQQPSPETCDQLDNDCDGVVDEDLVCGCPAGTNECGGQCVDLNTNLFNCGSCNNACPRGSFCRQGSCQL